MTIAAGQNESRRRRALRFESLVWVLLIALFAWRIWAIQRAIPEPRVFHDTEFYLSSATDHGYLSAGIWAGERSPLALFVFKCAGADPERIRNFFVISSALSWLALAFSVACCASRRSVRWVGVLLVLWLAVSRDVASWNAVVLSESLSFSSAALFAACALFFLRRPKRWLAPLVVCALLFALARDSNAYLVLFLGLGWFLVALYQALRRRRAVWTALAGLACGAVFVVSNASANHGQRWGYPLMNVIIGRVLPDPNVREQFEALGMPASPALRAGRPRRSYNVDPALAAFRGWLDARGKHAYVRYLVTHPRYTLGAPLLKPTLFSERMEYYAPKGTERAGYSSIDLIWSRSIWRWRLAALPALIGLIFALARERVFASPFAIAGVVLSVLVYPHALIVWHGDATELGRHGLTVSFQVQLALLLLLLALGEAAFSLSKRSAQGVQPVARG